MTFRCDHCRTRSFLNSKQARYAQKAAFCVCLRLSRQRFLHNYIISNSHLNFHPFFCKVISFYREEAIFWLCCKSRKDVVMFSALEFAREGPCRLEAYRKLGILCVFNLQYHVSQAVPLNTSTPCFHSRRLTKLKLISYDLTLSLF